MARGGGGIAQHGREPVAVGGALTVYRLSDQVVIREQGGRAFLLHVDSARYFELNRTGLLVWRAMERREDPVTAVSDAFPSVDGEQVEREVAALLSQLLAEGLIVPESA
jgi:hypothetical protein